MGDTFFQLFEAFIAVYLLFYAVTGKGKVYTTENIQKGLEEAYVRELRVWLFVLGIFTALFAASDYFFARDANLWWVMYVMLFLSLTMVVIVVVRTRRYTKAYHQKRAKKAQKG
ncbi:MAG: hypothetical protein ACOYJC_08060 [Christensenellales bacterium]